MANLHTNVEQENALLQNDQEELLSLKNKLLQKKQEVCELMLVIVQTNKNASQYADEVARANNNYLGAIDKVLNGEDIDKLLFQSKIEKGGISIAVHTYKDGTTWAEPCVYKRISSPFGYRKHPIRGNWSMHTGVDLTNASKTPIRATRSGVVIGAGWGNSSGYYVTIDHLDGTYSYYMHLYKKPDVKRGDVVLIGDYLGGMGTTGESTGVHLHFGIKKNGKYVNPMDYI
jgi:murein DD-endopeptidase MepM/ murein hydrolase activator NlpD